jgi:hypothetical protein
MPKNAGGFLSLERTCRHTSQHRLHRFSSFALDRDNRGRDSQEVGRHAGNWARRCSSPARLRIGSIGWLAASSWISSMLASARYARHISTSLTVAIVGVR